MTLAFLDYKKSGGGDEGKKSVQSKSLLYNISGRAASDAAEESAKTAADQQQQYLDYLKEVEYIPQFFRSRGTEQLGALYGLGTPQQSKEALQRFQQSPISSIYDDIDSSIVDSQEQAIARRASATGGLRSGAMQRGLAQIGATDMERRQKERLGQHLAGIGQISQLQTNPEGIYTAGTNIGNTLASGQLAAAQAQQQGASNVAGLGLAALSAFSDERLKKNVEFKGFKNGHRWHSWEWNDEAEKLGLKGKGEGVIAQYVKNYQPEAVSTDDSGYYKVDYNKLGVQ